MTHIPTAALSERWRYWQYERDTMLFADSSDLLCLNPSITYSIMMMQCFFIKILIIWKKYFKLAFVVFIFFLNATVWQAHLWAVILFQYTASIQEQISKLIVTTVKFKVACIQKCVSYVLMCSKCSQNWCTTAQLRLWSITLCNKWNTGTYFWLTLNLLCSVCVHPPPILLPWWPISHTFSIMINPEHGIRPLVNHSPSLPAPWVFRFLHRIIYRQSCELSAKPQPPLLLRVSVLYLCNQRICVVLSIKYVHSFSNFLWCYRINSVVHIKALNLRFRWIGLTSTVQLVVIYYNPLESNFMHLKLSQHKTVCIRVPLKVIIISAHRLCVFTGLADWYKDLDINVENGQLHVWSFFSSAGDCRPSTKIIGGP